MKYFLNSIKLYRWIRGGRWERWYHDPGHYVLWYQWDTEVEGQRPHPSCKGSPIVEVYE